jgi:hypothetical protein
MKTGFKVRPGKRPVNLTLATSQDQSSRGDNPAWNRFNAKSGSIAYDCQRRAETAQLRRLKIAHV